jgi:hypothetical protein
VFIFIPDRIGDQQLAGHGASVGFYSATNEVMLAPSFEGERSFAVTAITLQSKPGGCSDCDKELEGRTKTGLARRRALPNLQNDQ